MEHGKADKDKESAAAEGFDAVDGRECIWMKRGVVAYKLCPTPYDCDNCAFDKALTKLAKPRAAQVFQKNFWERCYIKACYQRSQPCPYAGPCQSRWSRTPNRAKKIFSLLGMGVLTFGRDGSIVQQASRKGRAKYDAMLSLGEVEQEHIQAVLASVDYNKTKAAQILGISPATLWRKLKKAGDGAEQGGGDG